MTPPTPAELQAIRERAENLRHELGYFTQAPADRAALLAHLDAQGPTFADAIEFVEHLQRQWKAKGAPCELSAHVADAIVTMMRAHLASQPGAPVAVEHDEGSQLVEHPAHTMIRESLEGEGRVPLPSSSQSPATVQAPAVPTCFHITGSVPGKDGNRLFCGEPTSGVGVLYCSKHLQQPSPSPPVSEENECPNCHVRGDFEEDGHCKVCHADLFAIPTDTPPVGGAEVERAENTPPWLAASLSSAERSGAVQKQMNGDGFTVPFGAALTEAFEAHMVAERTRCWLAVRELWDDGEISRDTYRRLARGIHGKDTVFCKQCAVEPVEEERRAWATPVCFACVPAPKAAHVAAAGRDK